MFDFDKVQKDFLSAALKAYKKNTMCEFFSAHDEENNLTYISNSYFFAIVPDEMCFITSTEKMRYVSPDVFKKMILPDCDDKENEIKDLFTSRTIPGTKKPYRVFGRQDGQEIWIDEKILAYFAGMDGLRYFSKGIRDAVAVYMYDTLVGMILPITH